MWAEIHEVARLAEWAKSHGIPALREADDEFQDRHNLGKKEGLAAYRSAMERVEHALDALPKEDG
jgi:hypothetical protein